eukprot:4624909-Prymnesium_polylepis.2
MALRDRIQVEQLHARRRDLEEAAAQLDRDHLPAEHKHPEAGECGGESTRALGRLTTPVQDRLEKRRRVQLSCHPMRSEECSKGRWVIYDRIRNDYERRAAEQWSEHLPDKEDVAGLTIRTIERIGCGKHPVRV